MFKIQVTEVVFYLTGIVSLFSAGAFGAFGALVYYLYISATQDENPYNGKLFSFVVMGFFVGTVADILMNELLGRSYAGVVLISGFLFLRVLGVFSSDKFAEFVLKKIGIKK
jgi:hypothetical protein